MNRFLRIFKKKKNIRSQKQEEIIKFSEELKRVLGIDDMILNSMAIDNHSVQYGDYLLVCNKRCFNRWVDLIEVVPSHLGSDHGYVNTSQLDGLDGWHYYMKGTGTEVLPPKEVRDEVIDLIKSENEYYDSESEDEIQFLESKKQEAIDNEDYEKAAELKQKITDLKDNE